MSLLNVDKLSGYYTDEPMKGNAERLHDFDDYHCLLAGSLGTALKIQDAYPSFPESYLKWIKICNGGLLFDTVMLTTKEHDDSLDADFDTFDDYNSEQAKEEMSLPKGYVVFAVRSYGDPICFSENKEDAKVYLWDSENNEFSDIWDSFEDWITEEIDDGIKLIAEDVLLPLEIKKGDDDE